MGIQINGQTDTISAVDGSITVATDLTVPGALTYDDVTNIDSVGIVTARNGLHVTGGNVKIGTTTEGEVTADNLTIADAGHCGMTIRSGTSSEGNIFFSDGTSGDSEYRGMVRYEHSNDAMVFKTATVERLRINSSGNIGIGTDNPAHKLHVSGTDSNLQIRVTKGGVGSFNHGVDSTGAFLETLSTDNIPIRFFTGGNERLRINSDGRFKIGSISDYSNNVTNCPVYIAMQTDITDIQDDEGGATAGLVRIEETGSNNNRYHGIDLRNTNSGDIRILNQDVGVSDRGDLVIAMPDGDASDGVHNKIRFNSIQSSIQISGKGGAVAGNTSTQHTDIYIATKTGVTAVNTGAGAEVAGVIRFEDIGSNNNRYHGIDLRNRNSGDVRILNYDEGATNKASMVFVTDNGSDMAEVMRLTSGGFIGAGTANPRRHFHLHNSATATVGFQMTNGGTGESNDSQGFQLKVGSDGHAEIAQMENSNLRIFTNASERLRITSGGDIGINEISPDNRLHITTTNSTAYSTNTSNTQNLTNALLKLQNLDGTDNSGVNNYVGIQFAVANGATSSAQLNYVRTGNNAGAFQFKARNASSTYPNLMTIKSDGKMGLGITNPSEKLHFAGAVRRDHSTSNIQFYEFSFTLPDGATTTIATVSNPVVSSMAIAKFEYVGLYGYNGTGFYSGVEMASLRRSSGNSAYTYLQNSEIHAGGNNSSYQPNIFWQNGSNNTSDLMITTGTYVQIMGTIRITTYNLDFSRSISV